MITRCSLEENINDVIDPRFTSLQVQFDEQQAKNTQFQQQRTDRQNQFARHLNIIEGDYHVSMNLVSVNAQVSGLEF